MSTISRARALGAAGLFALAPLGTSAAAAERIDAGDLKALDAAVAQERAAAKAYAGALAAPAVTSPVAAVLTRFQADRAAALAALVNALAQAGATATNDLAPADPETFTTEADVLAYVYALSRALAYAYVESAGPYKNRAYATLAASLAGATATHVALLAEALRRGPAYPSGMVTS